MAVYYRALLREIMKKYFPEQLLKDGRDQKVGKIYAKIKNKEQPFVHYCRKAFEKFKIEDHKKSRVLHYFYS